MSKLVDLISLENPVFQAYAYWTSILISKMIFMSLLTGYIRYKKEAYINPEDSNDKGQIKLRDPEVERVRRAHHNDLENIPILIIVEFFFVLSDPNAFVACYLIRIAAISRIFHTIGYAFFKIKSVRGSGFLMSMSITMYMAIYSLLYFR